MLLNKELDEFLEQKQGERDEVLQPSSLRNFPWPSEDPLNIPQPSRIASDDDYLLLTAAATAVPFDAERFDQSTRQLDLPGRVHYLLTGAKFQFNGVEAVRSEQLWKDRIALAVARGQPIFIVYPLFCKIGNWAKQMNNIAPNAGDEATIIFFGHLNNLVKRIYPPGLHIAVVSDAQLYNSAFQNPEVEVATYMEGVKDLIRKHEADQYILFYNYVDILREFSAEYMKAHQHFHRTICDEPKKVMSMISSARTLFESVKASINTRKYEMSYRDHLELFSSLEDRNNAFFKIIENMTKLAFEEVLAIRLACGYLNVFDRVWPEHVRATCHKGKKDGRAVIGLRPYPEYYGSSKLLPYHGVPLIHKPNNRTRLDIVPEVLLRGRPELTRILTATDVTYFYDGTSSTPQAA